MRKESNNNSRGVFAVVIIVLGGLWLLKELGLQFDFPQIYWDNIFYPFRNIFHNLWRFVFSWPTIIIVIGLILLAGKRSTVGLVLLIIGGLFLVPKIFFIPGLTIGIMLPVILIILGVVLITRRF